MSYALLINNNRLVTIICCFKNIVLSKLSIIDILNDNDLNITCLESDLFNTVRNDTNSEIYKTVIRTDLFYFRDISSLSITNEVIEEELESLIKEIHLAVNSVSVEKKKLIAIELEFPNTIYLQYL